MADDLSSFIEQQKIKLEKERADLSRNGNYTSTTTSQDKGERRKSPRGIESGRNHVEKESPSIKSKMNDNNEETGLPLGGYAKIQQKLKEERRLEYNKYLAEKNMRSTGKIDSILKEKDVSPSNKNKEVNESGRRSLEHSYEKDARDSPIPRSRRKGKENWDINDNYQEERGEEKKLIHHLQHNVRKCSRQHPPKETYEDILRRKRADERKYRGDRFGYDGPDLDDELRLMKLSSRNYKYNSRSDGYLSRRYDDDFDDHEFELPPRRSRRRRDRSIESKRVRFYDDDDFEDMNENLWSKPRRRLYDYDDNEDMDDLYALSQRRSRSRRSDRVSSAHEERTVNGPSLEKESIRRTKTDSEIRSQSAPLLEGTGIIGGGHTETREMKIKRQEKYKKELEEQMKQREENKKKEKMERFSKPAETSGFDFEPNVPTKTPRSTTRTGRQDAYDEPLGKNGPSSRPPQHLSLYPSPYDDPYYYYERQERGARGATALQDPLFKSSGYGVTGLYDTDAGRTEDPYQEKNRQRDFSRSPVSRRDQVVDHAHQPPGGYSSISGLPGHGQVSPEEDKQSKRAAQQAYQEELKKQMEIREKQKQKEKAEKEKYDRKIEQEIANYDPWGKGGAGAPLRDVSGQVMADLRVVQQDAKDGKTSVSPRNAPPSIEMRFENSPPQQLQQPQPAGQANVSPFGRSDPLKERQPHDDLKEKAKLEYQHYLKLQVEEKEKKKREEQDKIRAEEEREERRLQEQREKMQREYVEEQEKIKKKEEEAKRQNEMLLEAQNAKKREAERKRKEMEDKRQEELRKKLEENLAAKKMDTEATAATFRTDSPPIPTMRKKSGENSGMARGSSPPVPTLAKLRVQDSPQPRKPSSPSPSPSVPQRQPSAQSRQNKIGPDNDVLSQLTALRQQLKNEEQKVQSQIGRSTATTKYSQMSRIDNENKRSSKKDVNIFDRALTNKPGAVKKTESDHYSAADEFNRMKQEDLLPGLGITDDEDSTSLAGEFRSRFPQPATTDSMLDLQQQEYLREQEDKLSSLKAGMSRSKTQPGGIEGPSRSKSKDSLLESESQFIAVDDPSQITSTSKTDVRPRQPSARERRRWKQLEEMAKEPKPYDVYKPPTPGGFSLNSVTSFNVDDVAAKNEERLRRIEAIRRAGGEGERSDPDDVLKQFMSERRRPQTRVSEASLEAETSYQPLPF